LVDPLDREAVGAQSVVLAAERSELVAVPGEAQAAGAPERVARQLLHPVERPFRELHDEARGTGAQLGDCLVVRHRGAAQGEASVAPAGASRDLTRLVEAD